MQTDFAKLEANYIDLAGHATIVPSREPELERAVESLLKDKSTYLRVQSSTGVPAAGLMALAEREMTGNLHCYRQWPTLDNAYFDCSERSWSISRYG